MSVSVSVSVCVWRERERESARDRERQSEKALQQAMRATLHRRTPIYMRSQHSICEHNVKKKEKGGEKRKQGQEQKYQTKRSLDMQSA